MMKNIMLLLTGMLMATVIWLGIGNRDLKEANKQIKEMKNQYESIIETNTRDINRYREQLNDLENNVYSYMNGESYNIAIEHEGVRYNYSGGEKVSFKELLNLN